MSEKKMKLMRKLLGIKLNDPQHKEDYYSRHTIDQGKLTQKLIIDGTEDQSGGGSRIEYTELLQVVSNETRMQYRALKKLFKNSDHELHQELLKDLKRLRS